MASPNNKKVKGLLKGLRYISQIFDNEKEQEMQIGNPTDVKHVAHIGLDGPSSKYIGRGVNFRSQKAFQMNEFKSASGPGAPLDVNGDLHNINRELDSPAKLTSQDSRGKTSRLVNSSGRNLADIPRSSGQQSSSEFMDSPSREKSEKPRQRKTSKLKDSSDGSESPARTLHDAPKKSRRKKSKETSRLKAQNSDLDVGSPSGSVTKSRNKHKSFDEDSRVKKNNYRGTS